MITSAQIAAAEAVQLAAAHDGSDQVRLVAGPGTGKSSVIEKRVCWLIANGVPATDKTTSPFRADAAIVLPSDEKARIGSADSQANCPNSLSS